MKGYFTAKTVAGLGVLVAMVIGLQFLSNYVQFGPISMTLALFPIAIGAMLFGPIGGFILGLIDGAIVLTAPSTISGFMAINAWGTVLTCLVKTSVAGLAAGFVFKTLHIKHLNLAIFLASITVPIVNTGLFCVAALTIFYPTLSAGAKAAGKNTILFLFVGWITWNFFVEFAINATLALGFFKTYQYIEKRMSKEAY